MSVAGFMEFWVIPSRKWLKLREVEGTRTRTWGQYHVDCAPSNLAVGYILHKQTTQNSTSLGEKGWVSKPLASLCDRFFLAIISLPVSLPQLWLWEIDWTLNGSQRYNPRKDQAKAAALLKVMVFPAASPIPHSSLPGCRHVCSSITFPVRPPSCSYLKLNHLPLCQHLHAHVLFYFSS